MVHAGPLANGSAKKVRFESGASAAPSSNGTGENGTPGETLANGADGQLPPLPLTIFRSGAVVDVSVRPGLEDGLGTDRMVHWCGAQLQPPHR